MFFAKLLLGMSLIGIHVSMAGIFGTDDRTDTILSSNLTQELSLSVPALVLKNKLQKLPDSSFLLKGSSLTEIGLCPGEKFAEEFQIANCSASLIHERFVLTAGHCLDESHHKCENYSVVFDYKKPQVPFKGDHIVDAGQVYSCKKVVYYKFDQDLRGEDLAIIELDRPVKDRPVVDLMLESAIPKGEPLSLIGYPLGMSQKVVESGKHLGILPGTQYSFQHDLDSFSCNSGGPVFNQKGQQVGVLVRSTSANFSQPKDPGCLFWGIARKTDFAEANTLTTLKKTLKTFEEL